MEGSALQLENRTQVIVWLRENYKHATTTSVSKRSVFGHYLEACQNQGVLTPISHTYFGKLVRKAFPDVRCNRKGPRGSAQQHYRLIRVDGGDSSAFMAAHMGDEDEEDVEEEDEEEYVRRRPVKRNIAKGKGKGKAATSAAALRKNGPSRVRAAATAAASTISRMISADQQASSTAHLAEAWSFSSAPSSPVYSSTLSSACQSTTASIPSSPAQSSSEDDEAEEEYEEEAVEEEVEEESGELINFELPQFEITPGEESPGTSFSYEACPAISGHEQNLILQQQLQQQQQQQQCQQSYFEPAAFYDFVSPDLEMPLSAINQVNLIEDFGWNMPPTAVYHQQHQQQAYHQQQQQQQYYYQQSFLGDQLPAAQCSDLVEWVEHYCN
jgi:hypothetical protein